MDTGPSSFGAYIWRIHLANNIKVMFKLRMVASNQQLEQVVQTLRSISAKIHQASLDAQPDLPF